MPDHICRILPPPLSSPLSDSCSSPPSVQASAVLCDSHSNKRAQEEKGEIMLSPWFKAVAQRWLPIWWDALLAGNVDTVKDTETIHILS